jgi:ketosteroid isomerase-like protein
MTDENEQVVRRFMDAFNRRDQDGLIALVDPGIDFFAPQTAASVGHKTTYKGHEGMRHYLDDVRRVWTSLQVAPKSFHSEGECVVVVGSISGERDGQRVESRAGWAWKLRDGKVVWARVYENPDDAFKDAGMREASTH